MWKTIPSFPEYEACEDGQIRNKSGQILTPCRHTHGYLKVALGRTNQRLIHRLIAETFIPNPELKPEIDHINRDKKDNSVSNLRWVTRSENNLNRGKGYSYCERDKLFVVQKTVDGIKYRRSFKLEEDAKKYLDFISI